MTIDEISVKISIAADEAIETLDGLAARIQTLARMLQEPRAINTNGKEAANEMGAAEAAAKGMGAAVRNESESMAQSFDRSAKSALLLENVLKTIKQEHRQTGATDAADDAEEWANAYVDNWVSMVKEAVSDPAISEALGGMQETVSNAMQGFAPNDEQIKAFADGWALLTGEDSPIRTLLTLLADHTEDATDSAETLLTSLLGLNDGVSLLGENGQAFQGTFENVKYMLQGLAGEAESSQSAAEKLSQAYDWASGSFEENTKRGRELYNEYKKQADILRKNSAESKTLEKGQSALNKAKKDGAKLSTAEQSDLKAVGKLVGYQGQNYDVLQGKIKQYGTKLASETSAAQGSVQALSGELVNAAACSNIDATVQVDCSGAVSAIQGLIAIAQAALAILSALGVAKSGGGGGGGGGGKKDGGYDAEAAARAAEQARKEAIQRDYDLIEHKRHMNEITLEQELAMIEKIRTAHRLNAEEIMEWEEKIYDVKQEIRERDAESIDTLADGVVTALEARYEAMRSAELERLDASREAWETWRDDSVAAIEDQIAALEKLSDTEDREKKDAEELRKIEKLRRDVAYEQDDFNRMKLQKQLDDALEDREERLRKLALEDQKEALRAEIERINERADEQLTALDKEQEGIEAAYDERLKEAALNAEAEKLMMVKSQDEIMSLLREYVPEYNALGQSMGEKLLDGFKSKVGDVVNWFKDFNAGITAMQEQLAQTTNAAAESLYQGYGARQSGRSGAGAAGVAVNQTVNFYEPVESPSQVARRMEDVNDALGVMMG